MDSELNAPKSSRIEVADALRGFALAAIVLLHNVEHYDFYYFPETLPPWLKILDSKIWTSVFFLFSGKAYALFALLFGFSFFIQLDKQAKKGKDFRGRFLWRLTILLVLGMINSVFYSGDILAFYAILGVILIPICTWNDKAILITVLIFLLQPWELVKVGYMLFHPEYVPPANVSGLYFSQADKYLQGNSFLALAKGNLWNGRMADITWSWEQGRLFQTMAIFMLGMFIGRRNLFKSKGQNHKFWLRTLLVSMVLFAVFYSLKLNLPSLVTKKTLLGSFSLIISSWSNFALASILISGFILLYQKKILHRLLNSFAPFGRMSLTNYMIQSMLGSYLYYVYGLGLYKHTGATFSILIALSIILLQMAFSRWWLKNHAKGPLESLWHKATWLNIRKKTNQKYIAEIEST